MGKGLLSYSEKHNLWSSAGQVNQTYSKNGNWLKYRNKILFYFLGVWDSSF